MGSSDLAATDVEAAKTDAETVAKNRLQEGIRTSVSRLVERFSKVLTDSTGKPVSKRKLEEVNNNYTEAVLVGLKYEYFYYPNPVEPQKVYVRAFVSADNAKQSMELTNRVLDAAREEGIELDAEAARQKLLEARDAYLKGS